MFFKPNCNRFFGTALEVKKKRTSNRQDKYSIVIRFDDQSTDTIEYPAPDIQILTVEGDEAYVEMEDGERAVAYEGTLAELAIGDLVDSRYQAGKEHGAWFRGRVASVNLAMGTCDVVYYDKEVCAAILYISLIHSSFSLARLVNFLRQIHCSTSKTFQLQEQTCAGSSEDVRI